MRWIALTLLVAACTPHVPSPRYLTAPMATVAVEPARLSGTWYQIAAYPAPFQRDCTHVTATYRPQADGTLTVANRCRRDGVVTGIDGVATPSGPGQLKVRLQGVPLAGDYWVLGTLRGGRVVIVGTPSRIAGWVLSRDRTVRDPAVYDAAREVFRRNGYDAAALERTLQR
ncbi:MAG: lipocalin family protein [Paracoccaceae bacterium]|nr:MAG: lipocalin family protein [Paracoccaceae bacterium]